MMRQCTKCALSLPETEFHWRSAQHLKRFSCCKRCHQARFVKWRRVNGVKPQVYGVVELGVTRCCTQCERVLSMEAFGKNRDAPDGRLSRCKECLSPQERARARRDYKSDPEKFRQASRRYFRAADKATINAARRKRYTDRRAVYVTYGQQRRARLAGTADNIRGALWLEILNEHDRRCAYCLRRCESLELDHVLPLISGGMHEPYNAVPACKSCNTSKGARGPIDILMRPRLLVTQRMLTTTPA